MPVNLRIGNPDPIRYKLQTFLTRLITGRDHQHCVTRTCIIHSVGELAGVFCPEQPLRLGWDASHPGHILAGILNRESQVRDWK